MASASPRWALIEQLEARLLLSESATAQLNLVSTTGTQATPVYNYDVTLTNTGTTSLGTFWFAWIPGKDFLPSIPSAVANPTGWSNALTGTHNAFDGTAIEWVAGSAGAALQPGNSLSGFAFTTVDSPAVLAGLAPTAPTTPVMTSFVYIGAPLTDAGFSFVVSPLTATSNGTTTTLQASAPSAVVGDQITFTATVTPVVAGATPTGTVSFFSNGLLLGIASLQPDGTASLPVTTLALGADSVTATYGGDSTYASSNSSTIIEAILPHPHLAFAQQPVTVTAGQALSPLVIDIVDGSNQVVATDNSSVTLSIFGGPEGGTLEGTLTVTAVNGVATFSDAVLKKAGTYFLQASDGVLTTGNSSAINVIADTSSSQLVVVQAGADTLVGKPIPPIVVHVEDQFGNILVTNHSKVTLSIASGPGGALNGVLSTMAVNGVATFKNITTRVAGTYTLQAADIALAQTTVNFNRNILKGITTLAPPRVMPSYTFGRAIALAAMLKSNAGPMVAYSGTATVFDENNDPLGTATLSATGAMSFHLQNVPAGTHACTLYFPGDANHAPITSASFNLVVAKSKTTTKLTSSPMIVSSSDTLTLTASVSGSLGAPPRTGTVIFKDGDTVLDTIPLDGSSTAQLSIPTPTAGVHSYTAVYSGDANYLGGTSLVRRVTVH